MILGGMLFPIYGIIVIFIGIILLFLLGYIIRLNIRLNRLHKKYDFFMQGASGQSIEYKLQEEVRYLYGLKDIVQKIQDEQQAILSIQNHCFCKIGLKKYDAFDNMGNQLSFAITLLNKKNDGFCLSSIYGRNESRVFAKPIINGTCTYSMSDEEKDSLSQALQHEE